MFRTIFLSIFRSRQVREHYGVVIENGRVDRVRTEALRGLRTSEGESIPGDVVTDEENR